MNIETVNELIASLEEAVMGFANQLDWLAIQVMGNTVLPRIINRAKW